MQQFLGRTDTVLGRALERAGFSRARTTIDDLARKAIRANPERRGQIDALDRVCRREPDLIIALIGGEDAWRERIAAHLDAIEAGDAQRNRADGTAQTNDGDGGQRCHAGNGQRTSAPTPSHPSDEAGHRTDAGNGQVIDAPSSNPNREAGGHNAHAGDGQRIVAPASRPETQELDEAGHEYIAGNGHTLSAPPSNLDREAGGHRFAAGNGQSPSAPPAPTTTGDGTGQERPAENGQQNDASRLLTHLQRRATLSMRIGFRQSVTARAGDNFASWTWLSHGREARNTVGGTQDGVPTLRQERWVSLPEYA